PRLDLGAVVMKDGLTASSLMPGLLAASKDSRRMTLAASGLKDVPTASSLMPGLSAVLKDWPKLNLAATGMMKDVGVLMPGLRALTSAKLLQPKLDIASAFTRDLPTTSALIRGLVLPSMQAWQAPGFSATAASLRL